MVRSWNARRLGAPTHMLASEDFFGSLCPEPVQESLPGCVEATRNVEGPVRPLIRCAVKVGAESTEVLGHA